MSTHNKIPKDTVEELHSTFWDAQSDLDETLQKAGSVKDLLALTAQKEKIFEEALTTAYNKGVEVGRMEERNKLWIEFEEERKRHDVFVDAIACKSLEDFMKWKEDRKATLTDKQVSL